MALPVVAIIGRPNVGKSTLVNRLCRSREAIVHDQPGVTRDRTYQEGYWADRTFRVVDTGGLVFDDDSEFLPEIREQANLALAEAAVALVVVDGQQGCTAADQSIAEWLRGNDAGRNVEAFGLRFSRRSARGMIQLRDRFSDAVSRYSLSNFTL